MNETILGVLTVLCGFTAMVLYRGLRNYQQYRKDYRALPTLWWKIRLADGRNYVLDRHNYDRVRFVIGNEEDMEHIEGRIFPEGLSSGGLRYKAPGVPYLTWEVNHLFEWNIKNLAQRGLLLEKEDGYYLTLDGWEWLMECAWWKCYMLFYRSFWAHKWWALKTWARRLCKWGERLNTD